nr:phosphate ABC transporter substrate-binding protein [Alphaproteobacteria bacterium]
GENDNLIVQKLLANRNQIGIFGYSFLESNAHRLDGIAIEKVKPTFDAILARDYPISRALYLYVKAQKVPSKPTIEAFLAEYTKNSTWGTNGYLVDSGLIPLSATDARTQRRRARNLVPLKLDDLPE